LALFFSVAFDLLSLVTFVHFILLVSPLATYAPPWKGCLETRIVIRQVALVGNYRRRLSTALSHPSMTVRNGFIMTSEVLRDNNNSPVSTANLAPSRLQARQMTIL
jgi:hypothetical protein